MPNKLGRAYSIGYTALRAGQLEMETTSHNMANINTPAFKQRRAGFQAALAQEGAFMVQAGVRMVGVSTDFTQGPVQETGQMGDMALDGPGFFAVQLPDGQVGYTRSGAFHMDAQRRLVTDQGHLLNPVITVPEGIDGIAVDGGGVVSAYENGLPRELGRLQLAMFPNAEGLTQVGAGVYMMSEASGAPAMGAPGQNGAGQIIGEALESSNVNASQQMIDLVRVQRAYSLSLRALQITDQMAVIANDLQA